MVGRSEGPGHKPETIVSGTAAEAAGGVASVAGQTEGPGHKPETIVSGTAAKEAGGVASVAGRSEDQTERMIVSVEGWSKRMVTRWGGTLPAGARC